MIQITATWLLAAGAAPTAPLADEQIQHSRERAAIAEEQTHLGRSLKRLRQTMNVLADRLEAEGRPRAVELLRDGIEMLDRRSEQMNSSTLEEVMETTTELIDGGQIVRSIESQESIIGELELLLTILMDRRNLESLEEQIAELQELQRTAAQLAQEEQELREATEQLRRESANAQQRRLEQQLESMLSEQNELLSANEEAGRRSGAIELEQLERELQELLRNEQTDASLLRDWNPAETETLEAALPLLREARAAEDSAERLASAAEELQQAARELENTAHPQSEARLKEMQLRMDKLAQREDRHQRVGADPATERTAAALSRAAELLEAASESGASDPEGSRELEGLAQELAESAADRRADAGMHREEADAGLEELAGEDSAAGTVAKAARNALERAAEASERASTDPEDERAPGEAQLETEAATLTLQRGLDDLERLSEALSGSQAAGSEQAQRIQRGLETTEQADSAGGETARAALERAAEAMRQASASARNSEAEQAARAAEQAIDELQRAAQAVESMRSAAAEAAQEEVGNLAERQEQLTESARSAQSLPSQGSMDDESTRRVEEAVERATEAMQRASEELSEGRSASAARSQREAQSALEEAAREAQDGVVPSESEDVERAEELARRQEEIREQILWLATQAEEREDTRQAKASLERAQQSAGEASESLESGDLNQAEEQESAVEQELNQAEEAFREQTEQYQDLRAEELLFQIGEELGSMLVSHQEQIEATVEIDTVRTPGERPSRAQRLRLRKIAREENSLSERAGELAAAILGEGSLVFGEKLRQIQEDLEYIVRDMGEEGEFQTGPRLQSQQRDVAESIRWLVEALAREQQRREQEQQDDQQQGEQGEQQQQQDENRLVPNEAELKLLRRMELDVQEAVDKLMLLYPELDGDPYDIDPMILNDIQRLANRHERTSDLFEAFRSRLGIPAPGEEPLPTELPDLELEDDPEEDQ